MSNNRIPLGNKYHNILTEITEPETNPNNLISEWDIFIIKDGGVIAMAQLDLYNSNLMVKSEVFYPKRGYKLTTEQREIEVVAMSLYKKYTDQIDYILVQPTHSNNKFPDFIIMFGKMYNLATPAPTDGDPNGEEA